MTQVAFRNPSHFSNYIYAEGSPDSAAACPSTKELFWAFIATYGKIPALPKHSNLTDGGRANLGAIHPG